ncbi:MAG: MFS transporter [Clostridia bacterium]|nr:MFS transporter [Clostridia bacterium]
MDNNKRVKLGCYWTNISMSVVGNISPILFLTFRELYGVSFSLLGLLVLVNFCTQLTIDLIFSFFSHKFNIAKTVKLTPVITVAGLLIYSLWPVISPETAFMGIVLGTVVFSSSGGLCEVLISPVIAAIPADDPDREMSKLHSIYAWGVVGVVIFSTAFLLLFGAENWYILSLILTIVPIFAAVLFAGAKIPEMETPEKVTGALKQLKNKTLLTSVFAIFLGGAAECTMAQWCSGYLEEVTKIPKVFGDIFGMALFSLMLGLGRSLYAKIGKNINKVLLMCSIGATLCYFTAAVSPFPVITLIACAFTGFCTSMLWPGNLIAASDRMPHGGVFLYAMMASGGDLGASVVPQMLGIVTDAVMENEALVGFAEKFGMEAEQLGMRAGMLIGMIFPLLAIPVFLRFMKEKKKA